MTNTFTTVFEISLGANDVLKEDVFRLAIGAAVLVGGIIGIVRSTRAAGFFSKGTVGSAFMVFFAVSWLAMHLFIAWLDVSSLYRCLRAHRGGQCEIAEGLVHVTGQQPYSGHTAGDKIIVDGHEFRVDYFHRTVGYTKSIAHGGVLRAGAYVRLHYQDGLILKVEVRSTKTD